MKVNSNGKFIVWPNELKKRPDPFVVAMFQQNEEVMEELQFSVASRLIIPMAVHESPLYVALTDTGAWRPRFTDSLSLVLRLQVFIRAYVLVNEDAATWDRLALQTDELEEDFLKAVDACTSKKAFRHLIQRQTYDYIHLLESCLYAMFEVPFDWDQCTTPELTLERPDSDSFKEQFRAFFSTKAALAKRPEAFEFASDIYKDYMRFLRK